MNISEIINDSAALPKLTVIVPFHKTGTDRMLDPIEVKKMLKRVKDEIQHKYGKNGVSNLLIERLEKLAGKLDYTHHGEGVGFFISPVVSESVSFPFPVSEKIVAGNNFDLRELLYLKSLYSDYYILQISDKEVQLYKGNGAQLQTIRMHGFPMKFRDDYEYSRTSQGNSTGYSLKSTEKDKSVVKKQRRSDFFHKADEKLGKLIAEKASPIFVNGGKEQVGTFLKVTRNSDKISGTIIGNYVHENHDRFAREAFIHFCDYRKKLGDSALGNLNEAIGKKLAVTGISDVWREAAQGKGSHLYVERNYSQVGYLVPDNGDVSFRSPSGKHQVIPDAVDDIIEKVLAKKGSVHIVDNDCLKDAGHIALELRYE